MSYVGAETAVNFQDKQISQSIVIQGASPSGQAVSSSYGQIRLPEGRVVHVLPRHDARPSQFIRLPVGFLFASTISAMLQSRPNFSHAIAPHIARAFKLRNSKIAAVDWIQGRQPQDQSGKQRNNGKKQKKKKKATSRDVSDIFNDALFHEAIQSFLERETNSEHHILHKQDEHPTAEVPRIQSIFTATDKTRT